MTLASDFCANITSISIISIIPTIINENDNYNIESHNHLEHNVSLHYIFKD